MDTSNNSRPGVKAARKASASAALDPDEYKVTDFGRKRRNSLPKRIARVIGAIRLPFEFLARCGRRWRAWWGGKGSSDVSPEVTAGRAVGEDAPKTP
jgi:hypothetical protein